MSLQYTSDLHFKFPKNSDFMAERPIQPVGEVLVFALMFIRNKNMAQHANYIITFHRTKRIIFALI